MTDTRYYLIERSVSQREIDMVRIDIIERLALEMLIEGTTAITPSSQLTCVQRTEDWRRIYRIGVNVPSHVTEKWYKRGWDVWPMNWLELRTKAHQLTALRYAR